MDTFNDVWKEVLNICKAQVAQPLYNIWFAPLEFIKFENDTVVFLVSADYKKSIIQDKFSGIIKDGFEQVLGFPVEIDIIVDKTISDNSSDKKENKSEPENKESQNAFSGFTFDNFIVGKSNTFAYNVARGVCEEPGTKYNPLLIYGRSGLGKTHLMLAVYNKLKAQNPDAILIYTTGENFMNELVKDIYNKNMDHFHNKYRNVDALLMDDIQIIQRGESVQEEFFHTFNVLQQAGKQIVITSDIPPKEMAGLDERLRTRFEQGVIADIQPPDIDTRKAIIKRKCEQLGIRLSDSVTEYIAQKIKNNIRQLEGTVKKIDAMSKAYGTPVTIEQVQNIIKDITTDNQPISVITDKIMERIAQTYNVTLADIKSDKRQAKITLARQISMYVIKEVTDLTLKEIGEIFDKNHSTVLHSLKCAEEKMQESASVKLLVINTIKEFQEK
ncbi:MAG: chromosomal replication initiator protein DnaA [Clostridia bacterium]|nr:chromosomal replication initiator protein DnaA [Clostridia bacterium]